MKKYKYKLSRSKERFSRMYRANHLDYQDRVNSALIAASEQGKSDIVNRLLQHGVVGVEADVNATNDQGETALMMAAYNGYNEIVQKLLEKEADPNAKDINGWNSLFWAIIISQKQLENNQLEYGQLDNQLENNQLKTNQLNTVNLLIQKVPEGEQREQFVNHNSNEGETPLKLAIRQNNANLITVLRTAGASVNEHEKNLAEYLESSDDTKNALNVSSDD